ncbi:MAG: dicarboxylate/amino acid:cation symporter [Synergistaceae bacterium]|nr:dicarboxylate/amino acid:cation symporter [Synergistaceae bacterium]
MQKVFEVKDNNINQALEFMNLELNRFKLDNKELINAQLMAEEALASLIAHADFNLNSFIKIKINKLFGDIKIELTVPGAEFDFLGEQAAKNFELDDLEDEDFNFINNILLNAFKDKIKYKHVKAAKNSGLNKIKIHASQSRYRNLYLTLTALILAAICGMILKNILSLKIINSLDDNLLTPFKTMFLNAVQIVIGPLVYFSIALCVSQFENFSELGRVGGKILKIFALSSCMAILIGMGIFNLLKFAVPFAALGAQGSISAAAAGFEFKNFIVNIVPDNFIKPFVELNVLQIIFMALVSGAAVILSGSYSQSLRNFFDSGCNLFSSITGLIMKLIPAGTFCVILSLTLKTGLNALMPFAAVILILLTGFLVLVLAYSLIILLIAKLNPFKFLTKYFPAFLASSALSSSSAAIPINLKACKNLGAHKKVYSLLMPLGTTMHKAATCVSLSVFGLAMARMYGIEFSSSTMQSAFILIFAASIAGAGVGGGMGEFMMVLVPLGIPPEGIAIIMGIDPVIDILVTGINCMGNVACSIILSKSMGLLDERVYNK